MAKPYFVLTSSDDFHLALSPILFYWASSNAFGMDQNSKFRSEKSFLVWLKSFGSKPKYFGTCVLGFFYLNNNIKRSECARRKDEDRNLKVNLIEVDGSRIHENILSECHSEKQMSFKTA